LHEQRALHAAQPRAGGEADAFLLRGHHHRAHARIRLAQFDQPLVAGIGDVADEAEAVALQHLVRGERPICSNGQRSVQAGRF